MQGGRRQRGLQVERTVHDAGTKLSGVGLFHQFAIFYGAREMFGVHLLGTTDEGDARHLDTHITTERQQIDELLLALLLGGVGDDSHIGHEQ